MVRDRKTQNEPSKFEPIEEARASAVPARKQRARRRSFVFTHTAIANPDIARDIVVRVDEDFERIFGSED